MAYDKTEHANANSIKGGKKAQTTDIVVDAHVVALNVNL